MKTQSYAVVQSLFGTLWVGQSKREPDNIKFFTTHEEAVDKAMNIFYDKYGIDFGIEFSDDSDAIEEYEAIQGTIEIEEIKENLEKFVI